MWWPQGSCFQLLTGLPNWWLRQQHERDIQVHWKGLRLRHRYQEIPREWSHSGHAGFIRNHASGYVGISISNPEANTDKWDRRLRKTEGKACGKLPKGIQPYLREVYRIHEVKDWGNYDYKKMKLSCNIFLLNKAIKGLLYKFDDNKHKCHALHDE